MRAVSTNGLRDSFAVEALWTVSDKKDRGRLNPSNHKTPRHVIRPRKERGRLGDNADGLRTIKDVHLPLQLSNLNPPLIFS